MGFNRQYPTQQQVQQKWFYSIFSKNIYHSHAFIHKSFKALIAKENQKHDQITRYR